MTLNCDEQAVFAAWIYKCALVFGAAANGNDDGLVSLREGFKDSQKAGPGCVIYAGQAPAMPFTMPVSQAGFDGDSETRILSWGMEILRSHGTTEEVPRGAA